MDVLKSKGQKIYLLQSVERGIRLDGRGYVALFSIERCKIFIIIYFYFRCMDHRPLTIERGILRTSEGSSRVRLGRTEVFAVVNAELVEVCDFYFFVRNKTDYTYNLLNAVCICKMYERLTHTKN